MYNQGNQYDQNNQYDQDSQNFSTKELLSIFIGGFILLVMLFLPVSAEIVDAGERAVVLKYGEIVDVKSEGFYWRTPFIEDYKKLDVKTQKVEVGADAASKDLQTVQSTIALNYNLKPDSVGLLWQEIGKDYQIRLIDPAIQEAVKSATAKFTAEELVTKRFEVRESIYQLLVNKLEKQHINVTDVSIVNFSFSESFNVAIEAKVTAEQRALEAKNKLEQVKIEAEQKIEQAKADAEAIRIQAEAITQQGGEDYVNLKAVEKWNGVLPSQIVPNGSLPFIDVSLKK